MSEDFEGALDGLDSGRRAFLKKAAIGTAFAVPVVSSFTMSGITTAFAQTPATSSNVAGAGANASTTTTSTTTTTTTLPPNQPPSPA